MSIFKRAKRIAKTAVSGTSAVLDIAYELSGRRVDVLHQGAAFLYDISRTSKPEPFRPANTAPAEVITPTPAPSEPEAAPAEAAAPVEVEATPAPEPALTQSEVTLAPVEAEAPAAEAAPVEAEIADTEVVEVSTPSEPEVAEPAAKPEPPAKPAFPIENYDKLNVRQVQAALDGLDEDALTLVRDYERKHKRRKTILRAINKAVS
jgi:hypothetical protein